MDAETGSSNPVLWANCFELFLEKKCVFAYIQYSRNELFRVMVTFSAELGNAPALIKSCSVGVCATYYCNERRNSEKIAALPSSSPTSFPLWLCFISLGDEDIDQIETSYMFVV